jgi:hypothetical protein
MSKGSTTIPANAVMLSAAHARFVERHTSMCVATRCADNRPMVGRALGCRVSADRRRIAVFLSESREGSLLGCLRENPAIALTVSRPTTHETLQFKGKVVEIAPASADDRSAMEMYAQSFVDELASIGYPAAFARMLLSGTQDAVAVVFEPAAIYDQTPGPRAGTQLGAQ